jgi:hypothetical protein
MHEGLHIVNWIGGILLPSILLYLTFVTPSYELWKDAFVPPSQTLRPTAFEKAQMSLNPATIPISLPAATSSPPLPTNTPITAVPTPASTTPTQTVPATPPPTAPFAIPPRLALLLEQHKKCGDEIKMRLEQEEVWFHYKFAFLGVMLAGYLIRSVLQEQKDSKTMTFLPPHLLRDLFRNVSTTILLSAACSVCIVADMHIRANRIVIYENGSWIANVAEPLIFGVGPNRIIGWENFLRIESVGHHTDRFFHMLFWPEIFLVTVAVYTAYSYVFFWQIARLPRGPRRDRRLEDRLRVGTYVMLHALILICAVSTHYAPPLFRLRPWWWWSSEPLVPHQAVGGYAVIASVLIIVSAVTWLSIKLQRPPPSTVPSSETATTDLYP